MTGASKVVLGLVLAAAAFGSLTIMVLRDDVGLLLFVPTILVPLSGYLINAGMRSLRKQR
jgi:hypothetical protein